MQICVSSIKPARTDTVQGQDGRGEGFDGCVLLAYPELVLRPHATYDSPSLVDTPEERLPFSGMGYHMTPTSRLLKPPRVASGWDAADH